MALRFQSLSKHNMLRGRDRESKTQRIPHPASTNFYDHDVEHDGNNAKPRVDAGESKSDDGDKIFETPDPKRRRLTASPKSVSSIHSSPNTPIPTSASVQSKLKLGNGKAQKAAVKNSLTTSPLQNEIEHYIGSPEVKTEDDDVEDADKLPGTQGEGRDQTRGKDPAQDAVVTQLESALPPIKTDAEAIEAYEAYRAAEAAAYLEQHPTRGTDDPVQDGSKESLARRFENRTWERGQSSIYVDAFNLALSTVLDEEIHLFNEAERQLFQYWNSLTYEAQYLYVRLFLRKTSAWFRVAKLGYHGDIADLDAAAEDLLVERDLPGDPTHDKTESFPGENGVPDEAVPLGEKFVFAESSDGNITTLDEASNLLLLDELKVIAKDAKVRGKNKTELLQNLRRTSGKQQGLGWLKRSETEESGVSDKGSCNDEIDDDDDVDDDASSSGTRTPRTYENRDSHFTRKILEQTGKCIRLSLTPLKLFERVHLVFYRSTAWTDKSLTTLILAKISRRNFPEYIVSRSATIFESREMLLEFEASLRTQFRVDYMLEFSGYTGRKELEAVKAIFEAVYPRWKMLLADEQKKENSIYETGEGAYLRRFSPAWVYTRIVHKALAILGRFKEHLREHGLHCELLNQRLFHAARRGVWYQRKALLEEHYMYAITDAQGRSEEANKKHWKRIALRTCEQGLQDRECHIIYHYDLQKRIEKLEKQLRVPKREQHDFGHVGLLKPRERAVNGIKIEYEDRTDRKSPPGLLRRKSSTGGSRERSTSRGSPSTRTEQPSGSRRGTKTIWFDELDTEEPVSVESMCLSHYRKVLGFKGYHSEGGILRTLFGLLMYDVLFVYVPNVFQTPYQTCPLDLHTDSFYGTRISEINSRINEINNGDAVQILTRTWTEHYEKRTCVVGVRWDEYALSDLQEITKCWTGEALGTVMQVMAQEYGERGGGVPDLFLWKVYNDDNDQKSHESNEFNDDTSSKGAKQATGNQYGKVMFAEVKSENDRLSDTQRLWNSVLLNAGIEVELCHAVAKEIRIV